MLGYFLGESTASSVFYLFSSLFWILLLIFLKSMPNLPLLELFDWSEPLVGDLRLIKSAG